jgi:hypothetical protein
MGNVTFNGISVEPVRPSSDPSPHGCRMQSNSEQS